MVKFKLKVLKLDNALRAVGSSYKDMNQKIPAYKAASKAFNASMEKNCLEK